MKNDEVIKSIKYSKGHEKTKDHGRIEYEFGEVYEGDIKECEPNGYGVQRYGRIKYVGQFKNGNRNGFGKLYIDNKLTYKGQFNDNKFDGIGISYGDYLGKDNRTELEGDHKRYKSKYQGYFKDGEREGFGIELSGDRVYTCDWKQGKRNGIGYFDSPTYYYQGQFQDGEIKGLGIYYTKPTKERPAGNRFEGYVKNDESSIGVAINDVGVYEGEVNNKAPNGVGELKYNNPIFGTDKGYFCQGTFLGEAGKVDKTILKELGLDKPVLDEEDFKEMKRFSAEYGLKDNKEKDKSIKK